MKYPSLLNLSLRLASLAGAWSLLVGCASTPSHHASATRARNVSQEIAVGREIASRLLGRFGSLDDKSATEYVALVGQSVAQAVGRSELLFTFGVLATEQVGAYAAPGGYVFVTKGMLREVRSEAELAAILAHEVAHVNLRHLLVEIAAPRDVSSGEPAPALGAPALSQIVSQGIELLVGKGLGKQRDEEADQAAAWYTETLGYDPTALHALLKRIYDSRERKNLSSAYPPFRERLRALKKFYRHNGLKPRMPAGESKTDARFHAALARWQN